MRPEEFADAVEACVRAALQPVAERVKALESTPPSEPPSGPPGPGVSDYTVTYDGERSFSHTWKIGDEPGSAVFHVPFPIYRGVYLEGKTYERGDMVTHGGSIWHCNADTTTTPPSNGSHFTKDWTLAVKRGRDAKGGS
jgi:hypothetical protein